MSIKKVNCGNVEISNNNRICIIAGPCQLETEQHAMDMAGKIQEIKPGQKEMEVVIATADGSTKSQMVPNGLDLVVKVNQVVQVDQPLTTNPNVGGFGQTETEIVLQSPARIYGYMALCFFITLTQIFLVIKKKQFEKVQAAEMNF